MPSATQLPRRSSCCLALTLVNDALESNDGKQAASNRGGGNGAQDDQPQQAPRVPCGFALEEEVAARAGSLGDGHVGGRRRGTGGWAYGSSCSASSLNGRGRDFRTSTASWPWLLRRGRDDALASAWQIGLHLLVAAQEALHPLFIIYSLLVLDSGTEALACSLRSSVISG